MSYLPHLTAAARLATLAAAVLAVAPSPAVAVFACALLGLALVAVVLRLAAYAVTDVIGPWRSLPPPHPRRRRRGKGQRR
jgi:hypothetical protein